MSSITKKQATLALVVVAFAAIMIAGTIAASTDSAFAHSKKSIKQSLGQKCKQLQSSTALTAGFLSPTTNTGNNVAACLNLNFGGNGAAQ